MLIMQGFMFLFGLIAIIFAIYGMASASKQKDMVGPAFGVIDTLSTYFGQVSGEVNNLVATISNVTGIIDDFQVVCAVMSALIFSWSCSCSSCNAFCRALGSNFLCAVGSAATKSCMLPHRVWRTSPRQNGLVMVVLQLTCLIRLLASCLIVFTVYMLLYCCCAGHCHCGYQCRQPYSNPHSKYQHALPGTA